MELKDILKNGLTIVVTALLTFFLTKNCSGGYEIVDRKADTTSTVKTNYTYTQNLYSAAEVGKIKRVLTDSLSAIYKAKIKEAYAAKVPVNSPTGKLSSVEEQASGVKPAEKLPEYSYISEAQKSFVKKDSTGKTVDSAKVSVAYISPIPLSDKAVHSIELETFAMHKETIKETTIKETITVEMKKSFLENLFGSFRLKPAATYGYDVINNKFGLTVGIGLTGDL